MKIIISTDQGEVIDTYPNVEATDADTMIFLGAIIAWMQKTLRAVGARGLRV